MSTLFSELARNTDATYRLIVLDENGAGPPRHYQLRPRTVLWIAALAVLVLTFLVSLLFALTPLRALIPGYSSDEMRQDARMNALRLTALEDSLTAQNQYIEQLRLFITGGEDSAAVLGASSPPGAATPGDRPEPVPEPLSADWVDHRQPAIPVTEMPVVLDAPPRRSTLVQGYLTGLRVPMLPPVDGYLTRGFDARTGHYAVDLAVRQGTVVRSIGDGYVVFADWMHDGGYVIMVQHAGGYVSQYKHNMRLLKQVGDRVRDREAIALSGNEGEITSGPHLHFELWHEGLAQDPTQYFITW